MSKDTRSREELLAEINALRSTGIGEQVGATLRAALYCMCIAFVAWCTRGTVADLAGRQTQANISVSLLSKVEIAATIGACVGAGGILYGLAQRHLRRRTVKHLHGRIEALERKLDPHRTSSMLTSSGTTNPEDRL